MPIQHCIIKYKRKEKNFKRNNNYNYISIVIKSVRENCISFTIIKQTKQKQNVIFYMYLLFFFLFHIF